MGTIYDARGTPAQGILVTAEGQRVSAMTDADGSYRLGGLAQGEHELAVRIHNGATQRVHVNISADGATSRNIVLFSRGAVRSLRAPVHASGADFAQTMELAEDLAREQSSRPAIAWRWSDLEG